MKIILCDLDSTIARCKFNAKSIDVSVCSHPLMENWIEKKIEYSCSYAKMMTIDD